MNPPKTKRNDPVNKLARTLRRYKEKRIKSEEALVKIMEKVKLDKTILIKEKIDSIWSKDDYNNSKEVQHEIEKCKQKRHDINTKQKEAYNQLLYFIKDRKKLTFISTLIPIKDGDRSSTLLPAAEEKQILDAIKILLDNGYTLGEHELLQIFDMIGLQGLIHGLHSTQLEQHFFEFVFYLGKVFNLDITALEDYFTDKDPKRPYELTLLSTEEDINIPDYIIH